MEERERGGGGERGLTRTSARKMMRKPVLTPALAARKNCASYTLSASLLTIFLPLP